MYNFKVLFKKLQTYNYDYSDRFFDFIHNINTDVYIPSLKTKQMSNATNTAVQSSILKSISLIFNHIPNKGNGYYFYDIGSATGKVCFFVAQKYNFTNIIGIEIITEIYKKSLQNLSSFIGKKHNIRFIHQDCLNFNFANHSSVFFLFNPFNKTICENFLLKNLDLIKKNKSFIIFNNCEYLHLLNKFGFKEIEYAFYNYNNTILDCRLFQ